MPHILVWTLGHESLLNASSKIMRCNIRYMLIQLSHGNTGIYHILFRISQVTDFTEGMSVYVCA